MRAKTLPRAGRQSKPVPLWADGWYTLARRLESPNFGARPKDAVVDLVVVHSISLPPGHYGGDQVQALFTNQLDWDAHQYFQSIRGLRVSSHFFITREGVVWQFVSCDDRVCHAGTSSFQGRENCNDFSVGVELEGLEGDTFDSAQYVALTDLCLALRQAYPIKFVAGHEHIAPGRKQDPGTGFDWSAFARSVAWSPQVFPFLLGET